MKIIRLILTALILCSCTGYEYTPPPPYEYRILDTSNANLDYVETKYLDDHSDNVQDVLALIFTEWESNNPDREIVDFEFHFVDQYHGQIEGIYIYSKLK